MLPLWEDPSLRRSDYREENPQVVIGCMDPFSLVAGRGIEKLRKAGIEVTVGVLEEECRHLIRRFITFNTLKRPYITLSGQNLPMVHRYKPHRRKTDQTIQSTDQHAGTQKTRRT